MKIKNDQRGIAHVAMVFLVVVVLSVVGFAGWKVWDNDKKKNNASSTPKNEKIAKDFKTPVSTAPVFNKIPVDWLEYKDTENGFRLGYPSEWGTLGGSPLSTPEYRSDKQNLYGTLGVTYLEKANFSIVAQKYGATIKPSEDGKSWIVSEENPAKVDNYAVGDIYKTKEINVQGGKVIDLTYSDEYCTGGRWLMELKNNYVVFAIPTLCSATNASGDLQMPSSANKAAYSKLFNELLQTVTRF